MFGAGNDHQRPECHAVVIPQHRAWMHVFPRYQTPLEPPRLRDMSPTYRLFRPSALPIAGGTTSGIPPLCALVRSGLSTGAVGMLTARCVTSPSESQRCLESLRRREEPTRCPPGGTIDSSNRADKCLGGDDVHVQSCELGRSRLVPSMQSRGNPVEINHSTTAQPVVHTSNPNERPPSATMTG